MSPRRSLAFSSVSVIGKPPQNLSKTFTGRKPCIRLSKYRPRTSPKCIIEPLNRLSIDVELDAPYASGSFGEVFIGVLRDTGENVVLKRARTSSTARTLFSKERHINRKLDKLFDDSDVRRWPKFLGDFVKDSQSFLVWQLEGEGMTLADYLSTRPLPQLCDALNVTLSPVGTLQISLFKRVMQTLLLALYDIHSQGIVHRDVKPSNILVVPCAETPLQLIDFGSACETRSLLWSPGVHTLDPLYAAPETRLNFTAPHNFDVFSAAMVGISALLPSYASESRMREFRYALDSADYDFKRLQEKSLSTNDTSLFQSGSDLYIFFNDDTPQASDIFELLCGMFHKSPNKRFSVERALDVMQYI